MLSCAASPPYQVRIYQEDSRYSQAPNRGDRVRVLCCLEL